MLFKHELYVAEKTRQNYAQALRRSYQEPSLLEFILGDLLRGLRRSLRRALNSVDFPQDAPTTRIQPAGDRSLRG